MQRSLSNLSNILSLHGFIKLVYGSHWLPRKLVRIDIRKQKGIISLLFCFLLLFVLHVVYSSSSAAKRNEPTFPVHNNKNNFFPHDQNVYMCNLIRR